jgi:hypothetical protein
MDCMKIFKLLLFFCTSIYCHSQTEICVDSVISGEDVSANCEIPGVNLHDRVAKLGTPWRLPPELMAQIKFSQPEHASSRNCGFCQG